MTACFKSPEISEEYFFTHGQALTSVKISSPSEKAVTLERFAIADELAIQKVSGSSHISFEISALISSEPFPQIL